MGTRKALNMLAFIERVEKEERKFTNHSCKISNSYKNSTDDAIIGIYSWALSKFCNKCLKYQKFN